VREKKPDLVLMDIMMPVMDGFEATRQIKDNAETRHIPVIMVTALRDLEDRVRSLEAGVDDFLSKPVEKHELRARVRSLLKVKAYNDYMLSYQSRLESEVAARTLELQAAFTRIHQASLETIFRLSRAAEYKDENTGDHIQRMSNYAAAIARTMGFKGRESENLVYAASMHDIGKIGIPDSILTKPGSLTDEEFRIMKMHPEIGGEILEGASGFLRMGEIIARTHHERWDGSGYPRGLAGSQIPLMSRITMVADVFDALFPAVRIKPLLPSMIHLISSMRGGAVSLIRLFLMPFMSVFLKSVRLVSATKITKQVRAGFTRDAAPDRTAAVTRRCV
jgi:putative two-component system response regulator